jgi:hypothetical protein
VSLAVVHRGGEAAGFGIDGGVHAQLPLAAAWTTPFR